MNIKEVKEFLRLPEKLDKIIQNKLIEWEQWKSLAYGTSAQMSGERVQTSGSKQRMADAIDRYIDIETDIDSYIDKLIDTKRMIISVIERLNVSEYDVLHRVYIQRQTLDEVAAAYGKSYSNITTIHGRALVNVQKIMEADERNIMQWVNDLMNRHA